MTPPRAHPRRQRAEREGRRAETIALWYLRLKLYRLLARRYRTPAGPLAVDVAYGARENQVRVHFSVAIAF